MSTEEGLDRIFDEKIGTIESQTRFLKEFRSVMKAKAHLEERHAENIRKLTERLDRLKDKSDTRVVTAFILIAKELQSNSDALSAANIRKQESVDRVRSIKSFLQGIDMKETRKATSKLMGEKRNMEKNVRHYLKKDAKQKDRKERGTSLDLATSDAEYRTTDKLRYWKDQLDNEDASFRKSINENLSRLDKITNDCEAKLAEILEKCTAETEREHKIEAPYKDLPANRPMYSKSAMKRSTRMDPEEDNDIHSSRDQMECINNFSEFPGMMSDSDNPIDMEDMYSAAEESGTNEEAHRAIAKERFHLHIVSDGFDRDAKGDHQAIKVWESEGNGGDMEEILLKLLGLIYRKHVDFKGGSVASEELEEESDGGTKCNVLCVDEFGRVAPEKLVEESDGGTKCNVLCVEEFGRVASDKLEEESDAGTNCNVLCVEEFGRVAPEKLEEESDGGTKCNVLCVEEFGCIASDKLEEESEAGTNCNVLCVEEFGQGDD